MLSYIKNLSIGLAVSLLSAGAANAAFIEQFNTVVEVQPYAGSPGDGSVQYVNFTVSGTGLFHITAEGADYDAGDPLYETTGRGIEFNEDPEIVLFKDSVSVLNEIAQDDDGGWYVGLAGLDSFIGNAEFTDFIDLSYQDLNGNLQLTPGTYVLAVSEYTFDATEAVDGTNPEVDDPNKLILITVYADGTVAVCNNNCNAYSGGYRLEP